MTARGPSPDGEAGASAPSAGPGALAVPTPAPDEPRAEAAASTGHSPIRNRFARERLSQTEFIALMAMLFSTIAFSIDAMLPALPEIAEELTPEAPNRAQLIVTSFVLGMGVGTLFTGPLSDAIGRKPVILGGAAIYMIGAALAWWAQSLGLVLAARVLQGIGGAGPRVVALAIIRDLYAGRGMARLMSFMMVLFALVPALAPSMGAGIIALSGWRGIFAAFVVFSFIGAAWLALRQAETLPPDRRRPFRLKRIAEGIREIFRTRVVVLAIAAQSCCFAILFSNLSSVQQVFDVAYGRGDTFHLWFGGIALVAGTASIINASIVERIGMRAIATAMLGAQIVVSAAFAALFWAGLPEGEAAFYLYIAWTTGVFFQAGLTLGNLNALAMEPLGHMAGLAASVIGAIATVMAVVLAVPVGLMFDGTPRPLMLGTLVLAGIAFALMRLLRRERAG